MLLLLPAPVKSSLAPLLNCTREPEIGLPSSAVFWLNLLLISVVRWDVLSEASPADSFAVVAAAWSPGISPHPMRGAPVSNAVIMRALLNVVGFVCMDSPSLMGRCVLPPLNTPGRHPGNGFAQA